MSRDPKADFRRATIAVATAASLLFSTAFFYAAEAQKVLAANPPATATAPRSVPPVECTVFGKYVMEEAKLFNKDMSAEFLRSAARFIRSGCSNHDADGEIQIITMTNQDGASFATALRRMGKVDIRGMAGVIGCHQPVGGKCPVRTGANANPAPSGG